MTDKNAMMDKNARRPLIDPFLMALKSRRVLVALSALVVGLLIMAMPDLAPVREEMLTLVITLALALIGGYSVEDAATAARSSTPPETLREQIKEALNSFVDEYGEKPTQEALIGFTTELAPTELNAEKFNTGKINTEKINTDELDR